MNLLKALKIVSTLTFLISSSVQAGSWSSGGGEILEHAQNPWFIDVGLPTPAVSYCVVSSPDFPIGISSLEQIVEQTFQWWSNQFSNAHLPVNKVYTNEPGENGESTLVVGTNHATMFRENCDEHTDLAFQFGHLEPYQVAEFQKLSIDLTKYVALTIRTDYTEKMRGKGFIYVSPDRGPNAFKGRNVREKAWTENDAQADRLRAVLVHELGHVFGLQHGTNNNTIMSAKLAENTVSYNLNRSGLLLHQSVFFPKQGKLNDSFCESQNPNIKNLRIFFEIPESSECLRLYLDLNQLVVLAGPKRRERSWRPVGRAKFEDKAVRKSQLVSLWIPPDQTLLSKLVYPSVLLGAASVEIQQAAIFKNEVTGKHSPLFIQASPRYIQVGGVVNDTMVPDLIPAGEYSSLSGWEY